MYLDLSIIFIQTSEYLIFFCLKQSDMLTHNFGQKSNHHAIHTKTLRILALFEIQIQIQYFHVKKKTHSLRSHQI